MTTEELESIRSRYADLFGSEGVDKEKIADIERRLNLKLPDEFVRISEFYSGGLLGGVSHHAIDVEGPANNIVEETMRLRDTAELPHDMVVLAEPPESLIVLQASGASGRAASVMWVSHFDIARLSNPKTLREPQIWPDYYHFFSYLVDLEEDERSEML
ncbi:MAG TPA: SMI1/KNR4 family protein [Thermoanaerobaculia bacterium]|nr:SMI1/KNR4 family protein [Thermoanaerobaculia bacterium]